MSIEERKEREREKLRQLILKTSENIISQEGLEKLSIRKIANIIDYSPAIIYHYFKDKNEIIDQIMTANYLKILIAIKENEISEKDPVENLKAMTRSYINTALSMSDSFLLTQISKSENIQRYAAFMHKGASEKDMALRVLFECIKEINTERNMTDDEIELTTQLVACSVFGLVAKLIVENDIDSEQVNKLIEKFINTTLIKIAGG